MLERFLLQNWLRELNTLHLYDADNYPGRPPLLSQINFSGLRSLFHSFLKGRKEVFRHIVVWHEIKEAETQHKKELLTDHSQ